MEIALIKSLIDSSQYTEANRHLRKLIQEDPDDIKYQQLLALSYSRSGALEKAKELLEPTFKANTENQEISGIMGGIYKRLFQKHQDVQYGKMAALIYEQNYQLTKSAYTGINAASMLLMTGKSVRAKEISREIIAKADPADEDLWTAATLAEAYLITKNADKSKEFYLAARKAIQNNWGALNSIYKQLWLLNHYIRVPRDVIQLFHPPNITVFAGHMLDYPGRENPRFTTAMLPAVKEAIYAAIDTMDVQIAYSSLACGSDILFAEAMLEQNKTIYALLPFDKEDFLNQSIRFAGTEWEERFNQLLDKLEVKYVTSSKFMGRDESFEFLGRVLMGNCILHAMEMDTNANMLTVLSNMSLEAKVGGTRYFQSLWPSHLESQNVNLNKYFLAQPNDVSGDFTEVTAEDYPAYSGVCYLLMLKPGEQGIFETYKKGIQQILESGLYPYYMFIAENELITILFKNVMSAMDMLKEIEKIYNTIRGDFLTAHFPTIVCHAGVVVFSADEDEQDRTASGSDLDLIAELMGNASAGHITLTENFASCVVLKDQKAPIDYAGMLESTSGDLVSIYHINSQDV